MYRIEPTRIELSESTGGDWERVDWQRATAQDQWGAARRLLAY